MPHSSPNGPFQPFLRNTDIVTVRYSIGAAYYANMTFKLYWANYRKEFAHEQGHFTLKALIYKAFSSVQQALDKDKILALIKGMPL